MRRIAVAIVAAAVALGAAAPYGPSPAAAADPGAAQALQPGDSGAPAAGSRDAHRQAPGHSGWHDCGHHAGCAPAVIPATILVAGIRPLAGTVAIAGDRLPCEGHSGPPAPPPDTGRAAA